MRSIQHFCKNYQKRKTKQEKYNKNKNKTETKQKRYNDVENHGMHLKNFEELIMQLQLSSTQRQATKATILLSS